MKCPHCGQIHSDNLIDCPTTGRKLKRTCTNQLCSYFGEYLFPLEQETCPCCGRSLVDTHNGHQYVDLGLSVKWATCNVGAKTPEEYGDYFAWGETRPKIYYDWSNLKYCNGIDSMDCFSKYYKNQNGSSDNKIHLDLDDDAAHVNWGGSWRMPTNAEFEELINECIWSWTLMNGKNGQKITSISNGNSIFLPVAGCGNGDSIKYEGTLGSYWSCSLNMNDSDSYAKHLFFAPRTIRMLEESRYMGLSIRPVCP